MNIFAMRLGKGKHLKGLTLMGGIVTPEKFDHFHEVGHSNCVPSIYNSSTQLIINFEIGRMGTRGFVDGLLAGGVIGLPPIMNYGNPELQAQVIPEVLSGKKFICLAITGQLRAFVPVAG
jgi:alkylation response protein AidB-like acyl-CoA dehydrogenase